MLEKQKGGKGKILAQGAERDDQVDHGEDKGGQHGIPRIADAPAGPQSADHEREQPGGRGGLQRRKPPTGDQAKGTGHLERSDEGAEPGQAVALEFRHELRRKQTGQTVEKKGRGRDRDEQIEGGHALNVTCPSPDDQSGAWRLCLAHRRDPCHP